MKGIAPVVLIICDGWGHGELTETNAIHVARTPHMTAWCDHYPFTTLTAHSGAVGLPEGQMGNSEVGHLNIGAGRVVYQDYTRINIAIATGELADNTVLQELTSETRGKNGALHLFGLVSDGGVHSHIDHLTALVKIIKGQGLDKIYIHCFMDGRDTPPKSGKAYLEHLQERLDEIGSGEIATVIGRYYAMDRDKRWDRVELAWRAIVLGEGINHSDPIAGIEAAYSNGETDEFVKPIVITATDNKPVAKVDDNDSVLFFNFRADRARQLTHAFTDEIFSDFNVDKRPQLCRFVTCTQYEKDFELPTLFPPLSMTRILGEEISSNNLRQLRIAETEKYAHVTYFFNGGREEPYPLEDRKLIGSPRDVATYDLKPEMSAYRVTQTLEDILDDNPYSLIVLNFANCDMVGHSGKMNATVKACETVDICLGRVVKKVQKLKGTVLITADHGNADMMYDSLTKGPYTAHTLNAVPFVVVGEKFKNASLKSGGALKDIAPTILSIMGLPIPEEMEGESLLIE